MSARSKCIGEATDQPGSDFRINNIRDQVAGGENKMGALAGHQCCFSGIAEENLGGQCRVRACPP